MKKVSLLLMLMMCAVTVSAKDDPLTVKVVYNGTTATVTIPDDIASYVTVSSGTSSHVVITSSTESEEFIYDLSGSSDDGEFCLNGKYKCEIGQLERRSHAEHHDHQQVIHPREFYPKR